MCFLKKICAFFFFGAQHCSCIYTKHTGIRPLGRHLKESNKKTKRNILEFGKEKQNNREERIIFNEFFLGLVRTRHQRFLFFLEYLELDASKERRCVANKYRVSYQRSIGLRLCSVASMARKGLMNPGLRLLGGPNSVIYQPWQMWVSLRLGPQLLSYWGPHINQIKTTCM